MSCPTIRREDDAEGVARGVRHALGEAADHLQALRQDVDQPQLLQGEGVDPLQETVDEFGGVAGATADDGYFHD